MPGHHPRVRRHHRSGAGGFTDTAQVRARSFALHLYFGDTAVQLPPFAWGWLPLEVQGLPHWVSKTFANGMNINRVPDRRYSANNIGLINRLANGGRSQYYKRPAYTAYAAYILRKLTDSISETQIIITSPTGKASIHANMQPAE